MSCNCSNRMREYVLPSAGYIYNIDTKTWNNPHFPDERYRSISDIDVDDKHAMLTAYIAWSVGKESFKMFWKNVFGNTLTDINFQHIKNEWEIFISKR